MNRRGIFYSLTAIILLLFLVYAVQTSTRYTYQQEMFVAKNRVQAMNTLLNDLERDMQRAIYITGFRALLSAQQEVVTTGQFLNDSRSELASAFLNGTMDGQVAPLMNDSTLVNWTSRMRTEVEKLRLNLTITVTQLNISQESPWDVTFTVTSIVNLTDDLNTAHWNATLTVSSQVPITDFEDPFYVVYTEGKVTNTIRLSPYDGDFVSGSNTSNLRSHVNESYYIPSASAPDFLQRLEGNLSNSTAGMESMVNLVEFQDAGLSVQDRSAVDYIYFDTIDLSAVTFKINGTYESWLRIDNTSDHLIVYQVESLAYQ